MRIAQLLTSPEICHLIIPSDYLQRRRKPIYYSKTRWDVKLTCKMNSFERTNVTQQHEITKNLSVEANFQIQIETFQNNVLNTESGYTQSPLFRNKLLKALIPLHSMACHTLLFEDIFANRSWTSHKIILGN